MPDNLHSFFFDPNFNSPVESVYAYIDRTDQSSPPPPPPEGYFLLLNTIHFGLLNGQDLTLL